MKCVNTSLNMKQDKRLQPQLIKCLLHSSAYSGTSGQGRHFSIFENVFFFFRYFPTLDLYYTIILL